MDKNLNLRATLISMGVELADVSEQERSLVDQRWMAAFAYQGTAECHVSSYRIYRWHAFSYRKQPCLEGAQALEEYLAQWQAQFYVFNEALSFCALGESETYPDLSGLHEDLYVTHHNMKWTMVFTHEQPHTGPFFVTRHQDS